MSKNFKSSDIYPLTIFRDRYDGTYSGGKWIACNLQPNEIPNEIWEDDVTCENFWRKFRSWYSPEPYRLRFSIAVGNTKKEAIKNLHSLKIMENNQSND